MSHDILPLLEQAIAARAGLLDAPHEAALRLFSGFYEGFPDLVIDLYGKTAIIYNYAEQPEAVKDAIQATQQHLQSTLPWLEAILLKTRHAASPLSRRGVFLHGETADRWVREGGVRYALAPLMHQDAGFYLDTRELRHWATAHLAGQTVLNTFAYTGSLGVAAMAGKARRVVQTDQNRKFLNVAKTSYTLNGFPIAKADFIAADFWSVVKRFNRAGERFGCVFVDPPFFSASRQGTIDLLDNSHRVINKVRPLVAHGGYLVVVNNALFLSGGAYMETLDTLCAGGYLSIEGLIPIPSDITGYAHTRVGDPPVDPAPYNHPTKIAILRVWRKDAGPEEPETNQV